MIKEIIEFVNINDGIEVYLDARLDGIFLYFLFREDDFLESKIIKGKQGFFEFYKIEDKELISEGLESKIQKVLYYAKVYSKGVNNNFQVYNKVKSLDSTSPFFMKVDCDFDGEKIEFYKYDKKREEKNERLEISKNIEAHFFKAIEYVYDENYKNYILSLKDKIISLIVDFQNDDILYKLLHKELSNKKDKDKLEKETIYVCIDVGKEKQFKFDDFYLEEKSFNKKKSEMLFTKGQCSGCNKENQELSAPFLFTNYDDTFAHKSVVANYNFQVCQSCANKLIKFWELAKLNISNPLPLILYRNNKEISAFSEVFKLLDEKEQSKGYREIIKELYFKYPKSLKNYYLFNFKFSGPQKKLFTNDIDYVEHFEYMTQFKFLNFIGHKNHTIKVNKNILDLSDFYESLLSVFQFEKLINDLVFQDKLQKNYFSDYKDIEIKYNKLKSPKNSNSNSMLKNYLIKYRQNFYDYIYKSHQSALELIDFRVMLLDIIIDDIKHDDTNKDGYSIYENEIKEKLNLLFSIEQIKKEKKLQSDELIKLKEKMKTTLGYWEEYKDENEIKTRFIEGVDHIELKDENDKFFAFLVGQFARYLLSKSKAKKENLTHADFSGFLDWYDSKLLKEYITEIFNKYAHEFSYSRSNGKVENAISIIQSYKEDLEMDRFKEYMIAGYFSDNYFYEKTETLNEEN